MQRHIPSCEARRSLGRAARAAMPRSAHAQWIPREPESVLAILAATTPRGLPRLLALRWQRMAVSPFAYFRGAAAVMAADLRERPHTGLTAQICGDAHVQNLGAYASAEGQLVFDINDFDETTNAPFEWDLLRFGASLALAGREAGNSRRAVEEAVHAFVAAYRGAIRMFAAMPFLDILRYDIERRLPAGPVRNVLRKAAHTPPHQHVAEAVRRRGGVPRMIRTATRRTVPGEEVQNVVAALAGYRATLQPDRLEALSRYEPVDVAFRIVGTGGLGRLNYVVLMAGALPNDAMILQVKEALPSVHASGPLPAGRSEGQRVIEGQRLMQRASDPFLGWTELDGRSCIVRLYHDHKASVEPGDLRGRAVIEYAHVAGEVFARAHARSGDAVAIAAYCGTSTRLDRAVAAFAGAYAEQTRGDYAAFLRWRPKGGARKAKL